jgi:tetratricopeptide (TPR) repeat protein
VAYTERLAIEGEKALAKGDAPRALSLADQALGVDSAHARSKKLKQKARAAVDSSRGSAVDSGAPPPDAEPPSAGATETPQEKAKQFYLEGRTEARKGNDQGALKKFEDAIRTAPYAPAHKQLGILYAKRGEAERAMDHYKKYLKMSPNADDADAVRLAIERLGGQ